MPITIKNDETEKIARRLADMTGESLTDAIRLSVTERLERLKRSRAGVSLADQLNEIALRCSRRPDVSTMTADEILGYDEFGIPSR